MNGNYERYAKSTNVFTVVRLAYSRYIFSVHLSCGGVTTIRSTTTCYESILCKRLMYAARHVMQVQGLSLLLNLSSNPVYINLYHSFPATIDS